MGDGQLEVWQSLLVVLAWIAASLVGAALLLKRRDA
jgi:ABC-2 type transport system permease protein